MKVTLADIPGIVARAIGLLVSTFLAYNCAIAIALVIGCGWLFLLEQITAVAGASVVSVIESWLGWGFSHFSICLPVLIIAYIAGWFGFIYSTVMKTVQNIQK